jgi:hypothetical protein
VTVRPKDIERLRDALKDGSPLAAVLGWGGGGRLVPGDHPTTPSPRHP